MAFWLRHKTAGASTWTQQQFEGISITDKHRLDRVDGVTMRGRLYRHVKAKRTVWTLTISSDECVLHAAFLRAFFSADMQQISFLEAPSASTDSDGTLVVADGADEPLTYVDGLVNLKEYTFTLPAAEGS